MTQPIVVCAYDTVNVLQTTFANNITLTLTSGTGALTGGGATAPVSGCSTFAASVDTAGTGKKLTGAATGATSVESSEWEVTATPPVAAVTTYMGMQ